MSALTDVRTDIDSIINKTNEFAQDVTYIEKTSTYNDDNSTNSVTETEHTITILFFPESTAEDKVENLGSINFGTAKVFFKYIYDTLTPKLDDLIKVNNVYYQISQLKPWIVNGQVGYYEARVNREDLN